MSRLPPGWADCDLGEVAVVVGGSTPPSKDAANFTTVGGTPWITPADLSGYKAMYISRGARNLTTKGLAACSVRTLPAGSVLFSSRAPVGYVAIASNPVTTNQGFKSFILPPEIEPRFVYFYLRHIRPMAEARATGTTFKELSGAAAARLPLLVAPLAEQTRIADKLDALLARVDACREHLGRVSGILKRFRQSVLAAATSGELTREWREERGLELKWTTTRIEEIAFVGTGSTPLRSNSAFYAETGTPWITSSMTRLPFVTRAEEFVTDAAIAAHRLKKYPAGTLLVAMYGEGKTRGQVTELRIEATINQACAAICVDSRRAITAFVRLALDANYLEMRELAEGGNQPNLNLSKIKEFSLSLPSLEEQQAITTRVEAIHEWLAKLDRRLSAARRNVDDSTPAVLAKAFRGELMPQDPNDEPASALLARLRTRPHSTSDAGKSSRGGKRGLRKTTVDATMLKRNDVTATHLTAILKERRALTPEALWAASQLDIDDFYDQLRDEEARGLLRENRGDAPNAPRLLEPAA